MGIQKRARKSGVSYLVSWKDWQGRRRIKTVRGSLAGAQELETRKQNLLLKSAGREQQKIPLFGAYAVDLLEGSATGGKASGRLLVAGFGLTNRPPLGHKGPSCFLSSFQPRRNFSGLRALPIGECSPMR